MIGGFVAVAMASLPHDTLADDEFFLAYLMTYGTIEEIVIAKEYYTEASFLHVLEHAPVGVELLNLWHAANKVC